MQKLKSNFTDDIVYFRFFSPNEKLFYYTHTTDSVGFNIGRIEDFTPINYTWKEIKDNEL